MLVPINLTGGDFQHKSRPLSNQVTRNFWPQVQANQKEKSSYILQSFYGLKEFKTQSGVSARGELVNQGIFYRVLDTTLYTVASDGTHTAIGTIPGSNRCVIKALGAQIIIVNGGGAVYIWNGTTLTQNTSVNLGFPRGVAVINSQAIYDEGSGQGFDVSDVGEPGVIDGLNNASAESVSDVLLFPYAWREILYPMGGDSIELWWNSGQGNPPFDKIQGANIGVGLDAIHSAADNPDFLFFFGSDKQFHTLTGGSSAVDTVISTAAMAKQFQDYTVTSDCIGWTMQLEGQWFYVATFPTQNVTWCFPVGGEWFQWGTGTEGRIRANGYVKAFGRHIVSDYESGNLYELDAETYTDVGEEIIRTRDSAPLHAGLFKADGKEFEINSIEFILETGVGLTIGQGIDPRLMVSVSKNGGKTFGTERLLKCGTLGEIRTVKTGSFGRFKDSCVIRVRCSDPTFWSIHSAAAEIEVCI